MAVETEAKAEARAEVVFPRSLSDIYPAAAQQIYIETYKHSLATTAAGTRDSLSAESMASRDAWNAVQREFMQDAVTHKWSRIGEQVALASNRTDKRTLMGAIKGMFKH
jgi:cation transport regulator ChaB